MTNALPGDTIIVADGFYNWGQINFTNNNGTSSSAWIVLKAQSPAGVEFNGSTYLQFKGTRLEINGFKFANGSAGTNAVVSFRSSSVNLASYCRLTNIIFDNYNTNSADSSVENEWVGIYGTNNRVDHCSFINKYNARATVVVWYSTTTYPAPAISTYHRIDSNYFAARSYQGSNGGETLRIGDSNSSRTDGFNTIEYNLFENCTQAEPEIVSNKSDFNTYRYNTFKNCYGGLTLRHGRYCNVYGNFFINDDPVLITKSYGIRVIDKGHKVFNNYMEGLSGNKNSLTALRCPIILYNGRASVNDTTDASKAAGYFPADSTVVAFNTIVNCSGGGGIVIGFTDGGSNTFQPLGITIANNLIKMTTGQAAYNNPVNTLLTYSAEGNISDAPNGIGLSPSTGFTNTALSFGTRANGILTAPALAQDAAINTVNYSSLLSVKDFQGQSRTAVFDVGCDELNGTGPVIIHPLDSSQVGANKPIIVIPVQLIYFTISATDKMAKLSWQVTNEINFKQYEIEYSTDGVRFITVSIVIPNNTNGTLSNYSFLHNGLADGNNFYRIKLADNNGGYQYSPVRKISNGKTVAVNIYPNPAKQSITVDFNGQLTASTEIVVIDGAGRVVDKINATGNVMQFSTQKLMKGVYHLQLTGKNKVTKNYPFIIQ